MRLGKGRASLYRVPYTGGRARFRPATGWSWIPPYAGVANRRRENHLNWKAIAFQERLVQGIRHEVANDFLTCSERRLILLLHRVVHTIADTIEEAEPDYAECVDRIHVAGRRLHYCIGQ